MGFFAFLGFLVACVRPYWRKCLFIGLGLVLEMAFGSLVPFSFKYIVDEALIGRNGQVLVKILAGLGVGAVVVSVGGLGRDYLYAQVCARVLRDLRERMFTHLQSLSLDYYGRTRVGDVLSRFSGDLGVVEQAMGAAIPWGLLPALDVLANTALLFAIDWRLALVAMLVWPLCLLGPRIFAPRAATASYARRQDEAGMTANLQEQLVSQPAIKAFSLERRSLGSFAEHNRRLAGSSLRLGFFSALVERSAGIGIMLLQVLVMGVGAYMAYRGELSIGSLASFQALFLSLSYSLSYVTQYVPNLVQAMGGMRRIDELLAELPRVQDQPHAGVLPRLKEQIAIRRVVFSYGGEQRNLDEVELRIDKGQSVAFVGESGSGKSTLLSLILRFYDPDAGSVEFDGLDLRQVTQDSLRAHLGVVFQESFLFDLSVRENIRLGRPAASDAEVEEAAKAAEIHEFILGLPEGYDTPVGERGGRLSGGQRQRLAIARAVLRDPDILLLDEATSALDPGTEAAINTTLARLAKGRTLISVTHRLSSVVAMDRIFVLRRGKVVEQGSHKELLNQKGYYFQLWNEFALRLTEDMLVADMDGPDLSV
ncbi:MAG: ABC transporter ATP-binding protein [Candidatus Latescibacteria bacterium]|nr:ABC transporter ATP-binding protein [Candidatus Latescibacterota bacterium]